MYEVARRGLSSCHALRGLALRSFPCRSFSSSHALCGLPFRSFPRRSLRSSRSSEEANPALPTKGIIKKSLVFYFWQFGPDRRPNPYGPS